MHHWKKERIHSKVQENNISCSKGMIYWSAVSQENANRKFRNKSKEHKEIVQSLKLDRQNSSLNCQVIRKLTCHNRNKCTCLWVLKSFSWIANESSRNRTDLRYHTLRPNKSWFSACYSCSITYIVSNETKSNILV